MLRCSAANFTPSHRLASFFGADASNMVLFSPTASDSSLLLFRSGCGVVAIVGTIERECARGTRFGNLVDAFLLLLQPS